MHASPGLVKLNFQEDGNVSSSSGCIVRQCFQATKKEAEEAEEGEGEGRGRREKEEEKRGGGETGGRGRRREGGENAEEEDPASESLSGRHRELGPTADRSPHIPASWYWPVWLTCADPRCGPFS